MTRGAIVLAISAAIGCVDRAPSGLREASGHHASFSVQPSFPAIPPGGPNIPLAKIRGVLQSQAGEAVTVEASFQNGTATLTFDIQLTGPSDYKLDLTAFDAQSIPVYHSVSTLHVAPGDSTTPTPALEYSAPDAAVTSIKVTPATITLDAGATAPTTVTGTGADGKAISPVRVGWTPRDPTIATVGDDGVVHAGAFQGSTWIVARSATNVVDSILVKVHAPVAKIVFVPAAITVIRGAAAPVAVQLFDSGDHLIDDRTAAITSADVTKATVASGFVAGVAAGTTTLSASIEGKTATAAVTVLSPADHIDLAPTGPIAIASLNGTAKVTATLVPRTGASVTGLSATFASSNPAVATVDATGLVTAKGNGTTTITASIDNISATATITVQQTIAAVVVAPTSPTASSLGDTRQFTASAVDAIGTAVALGAGDVTWSSTNAAIATVDANGLATAVSNGTVTITATAGVKSASTSFTVQQVIVSVTVTPPTASASSLGEMRQFTATAADARGVAVALAAGSVTWASSAVTVATVNTGLATAIGPGSANITATAGGKSGSAQFGVQQAIQTLTVSPQLPATALGDTRLFTVTAVDALNAPVVLAPGAAAWSSSTPAVATVDATTGLATAVNNGATNITATVGTKSASLSFTVQQAIASLTVPPQTANSLGETKQFAVTASDARSNAVALAAGAVAWSSVNTAIATVNATTGLATAVAVGSTSIKAMVGAVVGTGTFTVQQVPASLVVQAAANPIHVGDNTTVTGQLFDATGHLIGAATPLWTSELTSVATVSPTATAAATGTVTGVTAGSAARIRGTQGNVSGFVDMQVLPAVALTLNLTSAEKLPNGTQQFSVTAGGAGPYIWSVNGIDGGNSTFGTITVDGLYTAPAAVPTPDHFPVCARRQAVPTAQGCATVTIKPVPSSGGEVIVFNDMNMFDNAIGVGQGGLNQKKFFVNLINFTAPGPRASRTGFMFFRGHNARCSTRGDTECLQAQNSLMSDTLTKAGYTVVNVNDTTATIAAIDPSIKVILLLTPTIAFTNTEINVLKQFASEGGRIVFAGERGPFYGSFIASVENAFFQSMGAVLTNTSSDVNCSGTNYLVPAASLRPHQITTGLTGLSIPCASSITLGPNDYALVYDILNTSIVGAVAKVDLTPLNTTLVPVAPPGIGASGDRVLAAPTAIQAPVTGTGRPLPH